MRALTVCLLVATAVPAQIDRDTSVAVARRSLLEAEIRLRDVDDRWEASLALEKPDETQEVWKALFGYNPPGTAVSIAYVSSWLYEQEGQDDDARRAAKYLVHMAKYRDKVPDELKRGRVEYEDGLPAVPSFFHLADYAEAWDRIRGSKAISDADRKTIVDAIAGSAEFIFVFPEWGAHNRALLRAECLAWCARAVPDHAHTTRWKRMAKILAADSIGQWEIEDAQIYHPIWLLALFRYSEAVNDPSILQYVQVRYYLDYFVRLLAPDGTVPAFGDAWHRGGLHRYYMCLEWGAHVFENPTYRWAAAEVYRALEFPRVKSYPLSRAVIGARLDGHVATDLKPVPPTLRSGPVLDDVIGKKTVFRAGKGPTATYLLHNFRDEGDWALLHRDYLRTNLAVEQEKMHHGASDENAIVLFMDQGSVLLHGPGYRDVAPSGPHGAYRADIFHNRIVARRGRPAEGQDPFTFLKDAGDYRPTRTERIDWVPFEDGPAYGRTRLTDDRRGYVWDRTIVQPDPDAATFVVIDTIEITRPGDWTFARLWATQEVVTRGTDHVVGRYETIRGSELAHGRSLLIHDPTPDASMSIAPLRRHSQDERVAHTIRSGTYAAGDFVTFTTVLRSLDRELAAHPGTAMIDVTHEPARNATAVSVGGVSIAVKHDLDLGLLAENVRPRWDPVKARIEAFGLAADADFLWTRTALRGGSASWGATNLTHVLRGDTPVWKARQFSVFQPTGRSDRIGSSRWRRWQGRL